MSAPGNDLDVVWPGGRLELSRRIHIMGILNVTPDSFSDGGRWGSVGEAVSAAVRMVEEGADVIDVGGESTRPGSDPVGEETELARVIPVIRELREMGTRKGPSRVPVFHISIDTTKSRVAEAALEAGADIVNDTSALRFDPRMAGLVAERAVPVILMHMKGNPRTMQESPEYADVVGEVRAFLEEALERAEAAGVPRGRTVIDPGIGFGKTAEHNLRLLNGLEELCSLGRPVLVGASRKSVIGHVLGLPVTDRLEGTLALTALAVAGGARLIRAHDVAANVRAARMAEAVVST